MNRFQFALASLACALPLAAFAATPETLKPYPEAAAGYQRYVVHLPPL